MLEDRQSIVIEEYLQEIFLLCSGEKPVKAVHLAARLQATPSTVHATLSRMQRDNLVEIDKKKKITLTAAGEEQAKDLVVRHHLAENFLCNVLGIPWYQVHKHAHRLEHAMSPLVAEKLAEFLKHPQFCPHGVPLEGYSAEFLKNSFPLEKGKVGMQIKIVMIDETLEESEELLKHLHDKSVIPGKKHTITEKLDVTHSLTLESELGLTTIPFDIARKIRVTQI
ncbi:MAG: metal-dependent transcriptional regulator [SAR324 cluster bacterium]|nr:metal-dependent transcriptional regulator [SAR324 cluster bacterium]